MNITNELSHHPFLGFIFSTIFYLIGLMFNVFDSGFPLWIMQLFQLVAWTIAIIVGSITIYEWIKKTFKKNANKRTR